MADSLTAPSSSSGQAVPVDRDAVELLGSIGFAAKGVLYTVIGLVTASVVAGSGQADQTGAIRRIQDLPFGTVLLILLAIGLGGYALLRLVHVVANPSGEDGLKGAAMRVSYLARAAVYGGLCATAVSAALGGGSSGGGGQRSQQLTQQALELPGGRFLVAAAAVVGIGVGLYQIAKGVRRDFTDQLTDARGRARTVVVWSGVVGHVARGVVFTTVGWLLAQAAMSGDPSEAGGISQAIGELSSTGYGTVLLPLIGLGLVAYGVYCFGMAAWGTARTAE